MFNCVGPAVIDMPALLEVAVVSTVNASCENPPPSPTTNARPEVVDMRTKELNWALAFTSKSPEIRRSFDAEIKLLWVVIPEPKRL